MGRWIDDYNDVEEKLEKIDCNLSDLISDIEDIPYDVDYYTWDEGCYEDVECDLEKRLTNVRKQLLTTIRAYNDYLQEGKCYADERFRNYFENKRIEVVNNEQNS